MFCCKQNNCFELGTTYSFYSSDDPYWDSLYSYLIKEEKSDKKVGYIQILLKF